MNNDTILLVVSGLIALVLAGPVLIYLLGFKARAEANRRNTHREEKARLQSIIGIRGYEKPKKRRRSRVHGFFSRMSSRAGRLVLKRRRLKGRKRIAL